MVLGLAVGVVGYGGGCGGWRWMLGGGGRARGHRYARTTKSSGGIFGAGLVCALVSVASTSSTYPNPVDLLGFDSFCVSPNLVRTWK